MIQRKILWNRYSENNPETHHYNFLIINKPGQIRSILQKLREQLATVVEEQPIDSGLIEKSRGLHYDLRTMSSTVLEPDFSQVYQGEIRRSRRLQPRQTSDGWYDFIKSVSIGDI